MKIPASTPPPQHPSRTIWPRKPFTSPLPPRVLGGGPGWGAWGRSFWRFLVTVASPLLFLALASAVLAAPPSPAAGIGGTGIESLSKERPALPDFRTDTLPEIVLPPLEAPAQAPLSAQARLRVERIELTGNTVFSRTELSPIIAPYEGREISAEELQTLRQQLTLYYVSRGYVNSGALIPDQEVKGGVVAIRIVEGRLSGIEISGNKRLREAYVRSRLELGLAGPLNMHALGRNVLLMHDGPVLRRIKARLKPGAHPGEAVLYAEVEEKNPWQLGFQFANDRSPSIGGERLQTTLAHHDLSGRGDTLDLRGSLTEGLVDFETSYTLPLTANDTTIRLWHSKSDSLVVEAPFAAIDIASETRTYGLTLDYPFGKKDGRSWSVGATLEHRRGETFLLGEPFSFSPDSDDGSVAITACRLSQDFLLRQTSRVVAFRQLVSFGLDPFGSSVSDLGPDENFFSWLAQAQWAERLGEKGLQFISRVDTQFSESPLLYLERFAVGGATTVRGYRENLLVRDNGVIASVELRQPLGRLPLYTVSREVNDGIVQLATFVDWGRSWNADDPASDPETISSLGVGLRWDPSPALHAQVYFAHALTDDGIDQEEHDLQDSGIHFHLSWQAI